MEQIFGDDKLAVAVKKEGAGLIRRAYAAFGWREDRVYSDRRYADVVHFDFARPHKIPGKDRLQLLQVRFEVGVNYLGKANARMPLRAAVIGTLVALIGLALAIYGAFVIAMSTTTVFFSAGVGLVGAGALFAALAVFTAVKVYASDKRKYGIIAAVLQQNIEQIIAEAAQITGVGDGH